MQQQLATATIQTPRSTNNTKLAAHGDKRGAYVGGVIIENKVPRADVLEWH